MIYESDRELAIIKDLCNIALRAGGLQNLQVINELLASLKAAPEKEAVPKA